MSELDDYYQAYESQGWSEDDLRSLIGEVIEQEFENLYWENIAPLEKQIKKLGAIPNKKSKSQIISFRPNRQNSFYRNDKWEIFFTTLMFELWNAGFLNRPENSDYRLNEKTNPNTMNFVRCFDGIIGLNEGADKPTWQNNKRGDLELCVYFIDELIRLNIITDHKKDIMIESVFGIKDPTRKRQKFATYSSSDFKPKRHKEIDLIIETSINNMS